MHLLHIILAYCLLFVDRRTEAAVCVLCRPAHAACLQVHHGNGTQHIFEADPSVLYMSLHRYDRCVWCGAVDGGCAGVCIGRLRLVCSSSSRSTVRAALCRLVRSVIAAAAGLLLH